MNALFLAGLLFAAAQGPAATLEVATGDWSNIPYAESRNFTNIVSPEAVGRLHDIMAKGECVIPGQSKKRLNITVPFLMHYGSDGKIDRLVLRKLGCTEVESVLGSALIRLAEKHQYKATGKNDAGWYRSEFSLISS
jgi:hypothetical protein